MSDSDQDQGSTEGESDSDDLTSGSVAWNLLSMAGPMLIGLVSMTSVSVVDTFFVGQLGTLPLAAISFCFPVIFFATGVASGLSSAVQSIVSRATGDGDEAKARRIVTHAVLLTVAVVAAMVAAGVPFLESIFALIGAGDSVMPLVEDYMYVWFAALLFFVIPVVVGAALMARGDAHTPMYLMVGGALLNAILDPILIFGFLGAPELGLRGAAFASAASRGAAAVVSIWLLFSRELIVPITSGVFDELLASWRELLRIGLPSAGTNVIIPTTMAVLTRLVATFGEPAVAAYGAGTRIQALATLVFNALGIGLIPVIGQNWGAGLEDRAAEAVSVSEKISLGWGAGSWAVLALASGGIAHAFVDGAETASTLATFLWIVPAGYGPLGLYVVANNGLNAIDRPLHAAGISVFRSFFVIVPLALLGSYWFGLTGVFASLVVSNTIVGLVSAVVIRYLFRTDSPEPAPE